MTGTATTTASETKTAAMEKSNRWIPRIIVLFFVVLAILNAIFITIALTTHRGVVTDRAYDKGLDYNATVAAAENQARLGWQGDIMFDAPILTFTLKDRAGNPIKDAQVIAHFFRPTQAGHDFSVALIETGGGYSSEIGFGLDGLWSVTIAVLWNNQHYQQQKRIIVK